MTEPTEGMTEIMKWCQPHWDQLRTTIERKGMGAFIGKNGKEAAEQIVSELKGDHIDACGFDPLMRAWSMISGRMMDMRVSPFSCPMCVCDAHEKQCTDPGCNTSAKAIIESCTDALVEYMQKLALIK